MEGNTPYISELEWSAISIVAGVFAFLSTNFDPKTLGQSVQLDGNFFKNLWYQLDFKKVGNPYPKNTVKSGFLGACDILFRFVVASVVLAVVYVLVRFLFGIVIS